jgi:hypothetical protein
VVQRRTCCGGYRTSCELTTIHDEPFFAKDYREICALPSIIQSPLPNMADQYREVGQYLQMSIGEY